MKKTVLNITCWLAFLIYLFLLTYFLIFADLMGRTHSQENYSYNLVLLKEIKRFYKYYKLLGFRTVVLNLAGNIFGFVPMGFLLPFISRRAKHWYLTLMLCFTFSFLVETVQLIWKVGIFDVDDMLLNTTGGVLGYIVYKFFIRVRAHKDGN